MAYFGNDRYSRDIESKQLDEILKGERSSKKPNKKMLLKRGADYIRNGIIKKIKKYDEYLKSGNFKEVILLCFSRVFFDINVMSRKSPLINQVDILLRARNFPFDKVIFVEINDQSPSSDMAVVIYDKTKPREPNSATAFNDEKICIKTAVLKPGEIYYLNGLFELEPNIQPRTQNGKYPGSEA